MDNRVNKLISIIIPVYNSEQYLKQCLDSVISQTYTNLEIILIDDCSTDSSGRICEEYSLKDNRVKIFHKNKNEGLSAARNYGIANSLGEYIGFVDSDDWIEQDMFRFLVENMEEYDADISSCSASYVDDNGFCIKNNKLPDKDIKQKFLISSKIEILRHFFFDYKNPQRINVAIWNKLYKRECVENVLFPIGKVYEDVFWTYRVLDNANRMIFTECHQYNYRQRKDSICHEEFSESYYSIYEANIERYNYILFEKKYFEIINEVSVRFITDVKEIIFLTKKNHKYRLLYKYIIHMYINVFFVQINLLRYNRVHNINKFHCIKLWTWK